MPAVFTALFGGFLGLALLKFGNPPIMEKWVTAPTNVYEFIIGSPWPITWAYTLLAIVALLGMSVAKRGAAVPYWLVLLPLAWVAWECLASFWTANLGLYSPSHCGASRDVRGQTWRGRALLAGPFAAGLGRMGMPGLVLDG